MTRGRALVSLATRSAAAVFAVAVGLSAAGPAYAAGSIGISDDGVTYDTAYPGTLYDSIAHFVPMDSATESFYIRNDTGQPGFLRVTLRDVSFSEAQYGAALSISASTPAQSGAPKSLASATPCVVLVEGQTVQPGEVVPIATVLALGDLDGQSGQSATANLTVRVELHDTSTGSLPAAACTTAPSTPGTDIIVVPPTRPAGGSGTIAKPATPDEAVVVPPASPETEPGELGGENQSFIDPNTWLLHEERWWLVLLLAFAAGSLCFMIVDWVRGRRGLEDETETSA